MKCESLSTSGCSRVQINLLNAVVSTFTANSFAFLVQLPSQSSPEEEEEEQEEEEEEEKERCNNTIVKLYMKHRVVIVVVVKKNCHHTFNI